MKNKKIAQKKDQKAVSRRALTAKVDAGKAKAGLPTASTPQEFDPDDFWRRERKRRKLRAKIVDGNLIVALSVIDPPSRSRSGKSELVASTFGVRETRIMVDGRPVNILVNAFVYTDWQPPVKWHRVIDLPKSEERLEEEREEKEFLEEEIPELED